jgi:uncharacterized protein YqjF (DUF2071 family)
MSRLILTLLLFSAGTLHFFIPQLFNPAIPFEYKWPINLLAGLIEVCLALGLWPPRFRDRSAQMAALWFLILTPVHIYVSWYQIPIFGISSPVLLWARTFFQPVLYFWALSLQSKGWIMAQTWKDVLFLHYQVEPKLLQGHVPFKLDEYQGKGIISIVSFTMESIRFPFLPSVPGLSKLNELNLRTYVDVDGVKGVYFFTLDADLKPAILIARTFFSLPYHLAAITIEKIHNNYFCKSHSSKTSIDIVAEIGGHKASSHFDLWATERYGLFTKRNQHSLHGVVEHIPWQFNKVSIKKLQDNFSSQLGKDLAAKEFLGQGYCKELNVKFKPFYKLRSSLR